MSGQPHPMFSKIVKTEWKSSDLHEKTVAFIILSEEGMVAEGIGHFVVNQNPNGDQEIIIRSPITDVPDDAKGKNQAEPSYFEHTLNQREAELITVPDEEGAEWDFQCVDEALFEEE